jgi:hypothetical protein
MTATQKIYALLSADATLTALVPASRIKPQGDWQNLAQGYIVHFPVSALPTRCYDGLKALRFVRHQVSVFAANESAALAIAAAVVDALDGTHDADVSLIALQNGPYSLGYDTDLKVAHVMVEFELAGALT